MIFPLPFSLFHHSCCHEKKSTWSIVVPTSRTLNSTIRFVVDEVLAGCSCWIVEFYLMFIMIFHPCDFDSKEMRQYFGS
ncbi:hypothetical protein M5689_020963 [Euphorbia peplus]|nr:hypothetical protein M5689_020963 [Euphorbia peplus]